MSTETSWLGILDRFTQGVASGPDAGGGGSAGASRSLAEAIDRLCSVFPSAAAGGRVAIEYQRIANGPVEHVLGFNNNEFIKLDGPRNAPYFSSHGNLTDLQHRDLPGSKVLTTFPVDPALFPQ